MLLPCICRKVELRTTDREELLEVLSLLGAMWQGTHTPSRMATNTRSGSSGNRRRGKRKQEGGVDAGVSWDECWGWWFARVLTVMLLTVCFSRNTP